MALAKRSVASTFLLVLITASLLAACSSGDAPAAAAEEWYVAVNTMEELEADGLVCKERREEFRQDMAAGSIFLVASNLLLGGDIDIEFDVSEVAFTTVEDYGDAAVVEARGEARGAVGGVIHSEEINERWLMKKESGEWHWCGYETTTAQQAVPTMTALPTPTVEEAIEDNTPEASLEATEVVTREPAPAIAESSPLAGMWRNEDDATFWWFSQQLIVIGSASEPDQCCDLLAYEHIDPSTIVGSNVESGAELVRYEVSTPADDTLILTTPDDWEFALTRFVLPGQSENPVQYDMLFPFGRYGACGYVDRHGNVIVEPVYAYCSDFFEGLAAVAPYQMFTQAIGYIDLTGNFAIDPIFLNANDFSEGLAAVSISGWSSGYIDKTGRFIIEPQYENASDFSEGLAYVEDFESGFYGFIDQNGTVAFEVPEFLGDLAVGTKFREGLVSVEGGYLDKNGDFISAEYSVWYSEGLSYVNGDANGCYYVDSNRNVVIRTPYAQCRGFNEGLAPVYQSNDFNSCGYIDKSGNLVIDFQFEQCYEFAEGRAAVEVQDQMGYIDTNGEYVLNPTTYAFDSTYAFKNGLGKVSKDGSSGYVDRDGNLVIAP